MRTQTIQAHRNRVHANWRDSAANRDLVFFGNRAAPASKEEHTIVQVRLHLAMHYICRAEGLPAHARCHCAETTEALK